MEGGQGGEGAGLELLPIKPELLLQSRIIRSALWRARRHIEAVRADSLVLRHKWKWLAGRGRPCRQPLSRLAGEEQKHEWVLCRAAL